MPPPKAPLKNGLLADALGAARLRLVLPFVLAEMSGALPKSVEPL